MIKNTVPDEVIMSKIHIIRNQKVMLDRDLAELYGVPTGHLNKAVKRNMKRFPPDFMFQLSQDEFKNLMFQNGTSSWGGTRKPPCAFTEQGVAMLSGVLNSDRAIGANILIIRTFTRLRLLALNHKDILLKLEQMENHVARHNKDIRYIFDILKQLLQKPEQPRKEIGYKTGTGKNQPPGAH